MKRCTLSEKLESGEWKNIAMGDILIYYDPELYCAKISLNDNSGHTVSNTVIGVNTVMEVRIKLYQVQTLNIALNADKQQGVLVESGRMGKSRASMENFKSNI